MEKFMTLLQEKLTPYRQFLRHRAPLCLHAKGLYERDQLHLGICRLYDPRQPPVTADCGAGRVLVRLWPLARFCHGQ